MASLPPKPPAVDKAATPGESDRRASRKNRRERRAAAKRSKNGTPVASGSSTPVVKAQGDGELKILGASGSTNGKENGNTRTFAEGDDFIPFTFSDPSEDEAGPSTRNLDRKGKGRETEKKGMAEDPTTVDGTKNSSERDRVKQNEKSKTYPEREWDRGKDTRDNDRRDRRDDPDSSRKRRHDDYDDGYTNKKERMDAASRKCPWVNGLDLDRCRNVAEMCA
jgi:non-canonical poly(A) RNA polymerase PAPD5/7